MDDFTKYLDDEKFVDWIAHPTAEKNAFWEAFMDENPGERAKIQILKECLGTLQSSNDKLSGDDKREILDKIYGKVTFSGSKRPPIYLNLIRYAAVFVILVGATVYFTSNNSKTDSPNIESLIQVSIDSTTDTKLILDNDQEIAIDKKRSVINFSGNDNLVINRKDTLNINDDATVESLQMTQLIVPFGKHSKLTLSDGSIVHVNSGSRLIFPKKFLGTSRTVYLDGEAFFEVESNVDKPFTVNIIKDDGFTITAVGTKFNVNSYSKNDQVTTVLTEGEVHLDNPSGSLFGKARKTIMKPGELAAWSVSAQSIQNKMKVDTQYYTSWIEGLMLFRGETLKDIVERLETYYNINIAFSENIDQQFKLTGKLDLNDSIEETLENLAVSASANFEKNGINGYLITK